ncbi:MAG TPA: hypothetical protein VFL73_03325 [Solirubrobacteraceae bacterium]|nr:hypothetical protein [Solirubrobacteraceae bacterium]
MAALFGFVQLEFPWALGPPDGRYVLRGHAGEPEHVLVTTTLGAPQRRLLGGRRPAPASAEPEPVATARATLVAASPFTDERAAADWLKAAGEDEIAEAIAVLNRVLHLQRTAAADPAVREVAREQALVSRVGYGEGEEVAHGRWTEAIAHPIPREGRVRRSESLRPQERLAALLGGRDAPLAAEELALRCRLDLDAGRRREAALQLRIALEAALAELEPWRARVGERLDELREARGTVGDAANAALQGGLDDARTADVERVLSRLEAALRARIAAGLD